MPFSVSSNSLLGTSLAVVLLAAAVFPARVSAEKLYGPGVSDTEIKVGQTMPYSGPQSAASAIGRAELAYFAKLNAEGGINGRKVILISLDDGYSYARTLEQVRRLVEQDRVLLLFSLVGKSTNLAIRKYANVSGVPHLFAASGDNAWSDYAHFPWTMGWAVPNRTKARVYAQHILRTKPNARIGLLYANDDYAHDYVDGFKEALGEKSTTMIVGEQTVEQTDATLDAQIYALRASGADTLFSAMLGKRTSQALHKMAEIGWRPLHYVAVSSTVTETMLRRAGLEHAGGLITAHYAKDIDFTRYGKDPDVEAYAEWAKTYYAGDAYDGIASHGYLAARVLEYVLRRCGDDLTRENVLRAAASMRDVDFPMLLPGVHVSTGRTDYLPIKQLQMLQFDGSGWQPIGKVMSLQ